MTPGTAAVACLLALAGAGPDVPGRPGAAAELAEPAPAIVARRRAAAVHLDGRLDDPAWAEAQPFSRFIESFPQPGAPASFPTEVRVLFDDATLYVGIRCVDPEPGRIVRQLARRDADVAADRVEVALDPGASGRTAYVFSVNAAGVLRDELVFAGVSSTETWDAVWDAAVHVDGEGWSAELAIPLRQLRFARTPEQSWGILVRRYVPRTHQIFGSALIPRHANPVKTDGLVVARFGRLEGLDGLAPPRGLELLPYLAARVTRRPRYSDPSRPRPTLLDPALDLGLDLELPLGERLTLTGAVNPDFGQVEADQLIQNLSTAEPYFPEKRPFFLEGLDIFQPVGSGYGTPQQLFYSRRIGLDAPILGAAKLTGAARPGLEIGVLDALVMGAGNASLVPVGYGPADPATLAPYEAHPDRRWRLRLRQPFHLGPEDALPAAHPVTTNYLAAVARQRLGGAALGATLTAASPLEPRCRRGEFESDADFRAAGCASHGGNALALDLDVPGEWGGFAQVEASQAVGGPAEGRRLRDGTVLRDGDVGYGGHMRWGKLGGEPWRFDVQYVYEDPRLDLNQVGFQQFSDYQWVDLTVKYVRPTGVGALHALQLDYLLDVNWTADGRLPRGINTNVHGEVQLPGYEKLGARLSLELPQYDTREIAGAGVPFERTGSWFVTLILASDPNRRLQASGDVFVIRTLGAGPFTARTGWGWDLTASWTPHPRLETRLEGSYGLKPQGPRWIETLGDGTAVFGSQDPEFVSLTLRQQLVFTPRLSAQLYAQLFSAAVRWGSTFYGASLAGRRDLSHSDLVPVGYAGTPASHEAALNVNAVLRWEYRLGSTLYLVYTRAQRERPPAPGERVPDGLGAPELFRGPTVDTVLVKWSWWRGG